MKKTVEKKQKHGEYWKENNSNLSKNILMPKTEFEKKKKGKNKNNRITEQKMNAINAQTNKCKQKKEI